MSTHRNLFVIDGKRTSIPAIRRATGLDHREIARRISRGATTMNELRDDFRGRNFIPWTLAEHRVVIESSAVDAALILDRSLNAVYLYRVRAGIAKRNAA